MPIPTVNTPSNIPSNQRDNSKPLGLDEADYSRKQIWDLVQQGKYELALQNSPQKDLKPILNHWLSKYSSVDVKNDDQILDLVENWYVYFKSIYDRTNPFFAYLKFLKKLGVKPKYNDLVVVNNKYQEKVLTDEDLRENNSVLENVNFYGKEVKDQNFWLDVYAFFSQPKEVERALVNYPEETLKIGNDTFYVSDLKRINSGTNTYILRDSLLFDGGNRNSTLRTMSTIRNATDRLYEYMNKDDYSKETKPKKEKDYNNKYKLKDFIEDNSNALSDKDLRNDLRLWLDEE